MAKLNPVTPGELLREEFLVPMGLSQYRLARKIGVPAQRIGEIVAGKRAITADTDLRLCRFFGRLLGLHRLRLRRIARAEQRQRERDAEWSESYELGHGNSLSCTA